jgi:hypothetical protein
MRYHRVIIIVPPGVRKDMLGVRKIENKYIWNKLNNLINRWEPH